MPALSEYTNVYGTALAIIQDKGFRTWFDSSTNVFCAERDGWDFQSPSPCALLGLIAIFEFQSPPRWKEYWWRTDVQVDHRKLPLAKPTYQPVWQKESQ
jgi:hypothetical protein